MIWTLEKGTIPLGEPEAVAQQSLHGELDVVFATDPGGQTILQQRFRKGLFHFGKSYLVGDAQVLQVLNPTAGIFEGDSLQSQFLLRDGAQACILSPSATQVYQMTGNGMARSRQRLTIRGQSSLVYLPKSLVLHREASLSQVTDIQIERGSRLLFLEQVSAGRQAFGEFLNYTFFDAVTSIYLGSRLLLRERMRCGKEMNRWVWNMQGQSASVLANVVVSFPGVAHCATRLLGDLVDGTAGSLLAGYSSIDEDLVIIRALSAGTIPLQHFTRSLCQILITQFPVLEVCDRLP